MRAESNILVRLFRSGQAGHIEAGATEIIATTGAGRSILPYERVHRLVEHRGIFWSSITVCPIGAPAPEITIDGVSRADVRALRGLVLERSLERQLAKALTESRQLLQADRFLNFTVWRNWISAHGVMLASIPPDVDELPVSKSIRCAIAEFQRCAQDGESLRQLHNREYVERELSLHQAWFDQVESHPLTQRQRQAVVCDEDNTLVVAGAGTGKTSTIMGKVRYLLRKGQVRPGEILLLAFARKAKEEMQQRLQERFGQPLEVRTFHSLGLEIIAHVEEVRPSISPLAETPDKLPTAVEGYLDGLFEDPNSSPALIKFLTEHRYPQRSEHDYTTAHAYYQFLKAHDIRTLRGEQVKSTGELVIADFLTINGVKYQYEADYEHPTATVEHRQYKPDFYLPDYGIYIEYFGIDREGKTARYISRRDYHAGMEWKRSTHRTHGTTMVEVFSYEHWEGNLLDVLRRHLSQHGVQFAPISGDELRQITKDSGEASRIAKLLCAFLNLYKSNVWTPAEVRSRAEPRPDARRCQAFIDVFERVLAAYESELASSRKIDFHDMIVRATGYASSGKFRSPFRYVLVDEFQDISRGRAALVKAMLAQHEDRRLFCVGDDWQSIYRFTGSDVGLMTGFQEQFGHTQRVDLDRTFRFCNEILEASQRFVLKNPQQLRKQITAPHALGRPGTVIVYERTSDAQGAGLQRALAEIQRQESGNQASVMILGRYRFTLPADFQNLGRRYRGLRLEQHTVHGAKGLEADYVVVLDVIRGRLGFPTEVSDDPVLSLVLARPDEFPNAEERRLFYVALTRARKRAYLITDESRRSTFITELEAADFAGLVQSEGAGKQLPCPKCDGGGTDLL